MSQIPDIVEQIGAPNWGKPMTSELANFRRRLAAKMGEV